MRFTFLSRKSVDRTSEVVKGDDDAAERREDGLDSTVKTDSRQIGSDPVVEQVGKPLVGLDRLSKAYLHLGSHRSNWARRPLGTRPGETGEHGE